MNENRDDLFRKLRAALPEFPDADIEAAADLLATRQEQRSMRQPPKPTGPRANNHVRARRIAKLWDAYKLARGHKSVKQGASSFIRSLPADLQLRENSRRADKSGPPIKSLANLITRGTNINRQRAGLRRLAYLLREHDRLRAQGTRRMSLDRGAILAGRAGRSKDLAEIEELIGETEAWLEAARSALLGEAQGGIFKLK